VIGGSLDLEAVRHLVDEYTSWLVQADLNEEDRAEAGAEIATIRSQLTSSRPKNTIISESLKTLRSLAESVAAGVATHTLLQQFDALTPIR
jgi:hypothetical protein